MRTKEKKYKSAIMIVLLLAYLFNYTAYVNAAEITPSEKNAYDLALTVVSKLDRGEDAYITDEYDIVHEDGSYYGKSFGYAVDGEPYGYAVFDETKGRITQFEFKKGVKNIYTRLSAELDEDKADVADGLVVANDNPYCVMVFDETGKTVDNFDSSKKVKNPHKIKETLEQDEKAAPTSTSTDYNVLYHFDSASNLKPYLSDRYGKKYYSGFSRSILQTYTQDNVQRYASRQYACTVVAAMVALTMQERVRGYCWHLYDQIYDGAGANNGGLILKDLASYLDIYFKNNYRTNGYKCYVKEEDVHFADIKNAVDKDYKSLLSLWPKLNNAHTVPVLGYYSYYFKQGYCVDYIMVANDWYDTEERYFDSVYLNEMAAESEFMYMKPYVYSYK